MTQETDAPDLIIDRRPIPADVAGRMRTLERPPVATDASSLDPEEFAERAIEALDEIEDGLYADFGVRNDLTRLGVSEGRNTITGARGLILRRLIHRGRYSAPLAEIFTEEGRLDVHGKLSFHNFRFSAYRRGLNYWIHKIESQDGPFLIAFAIAFGSEARGHPTYLARLLVTEFEIDQWRNEFLEIGCARPS